MDERYSKIELLFQVGRYAECRRIASTLLASDPHDGRALVWMAEISLEEDDPRAARGFAETAVATDPGSRSALRILAQAELRCGRCHEARRVVRRLLEHSLRPQDLCLHAVISMHCDRRHEAWVLSERVQQQSPEDPVPWFVQGRIRIREGRLLEAERLLRGALERAPEFTAAQHALAQIKKRSGDTHEARRLLNRLMAIDPMHHEGRQTLTSVLLEVLLQGEAGRRRFSVCFQLGAATIVFAVVWFLAEGIFGPFPQPVFAKFVDPLPASAVGFVPVFLSVTAPLAWRRFVQSFPAEEGLRLRWLLRAHFTNVVRNRLAELLLGSTLLLFFSTLFSAANGWSLEGFLGLPVFLWYVIAGIAAIFFPLCFVLLLGRSAADAGLHLFRRRFGKPFERQHAGWEVVAWVAALCVLFDATYQLHEKQLVLVVLVLALIAIERYFARYLPRTTAFVLCAATALQAPVLRWLYPEADSMYEWMIVIAFVCFVKLLHSLGSGQAYERLLQTEWPTSRSDGLRRSRDA